MSAVLKGHIYGDPRSSALRSQIFGVEDASLNLANVAGLATARAPMVANRMSVMYDPRGDALAGVHASVQRIVANAAVPGDYRRTSIYRQQARGITYSGSNPLKKYETLDASSKAVQPVTNVYNNSTTHNTVAAPEPPREIGKLERVLDRVENTSLDIIDRLTRAAIDGNGLGTVVETRDNDTQADAPDMITDGTQAGPAGLIDQGIQAAQSMLTSGSQTPGPMVGQAMEQLAIEPAGRRRRGSLPYDPSMWDRPRRELMPLAPPPPPPPAMMMEIEPAQLNQLAPPPPPPDRLQIEPREAYIEAAPEPMQIEAGPGEIARTSAGDKMLGKLLARKPGKKEMPVGKLRVKQRQNAQRTRNTATSSEMVRLREPTPMDDVHVNEQNALVLRAPQEQQPVALRGVQQLGDATLDYSDAVALVTAAAPPAGPSSAGHTVVVGGQTYRLPEDAERLAELFTDSPAQAIFREYNAAYQAGGASAPIDVASDSDDEEYQEGLVQASASQRMTDPLYRRVPEWIMQIAVREEWNPLMCLERWKADPRWHGQDHPLRGWTPPPNSVFYAEARAFNRSN